MTGGVCCSVPCPGYADSATAGRAPDASRSSSPAGVCSAVSSSRARATRRLRSHRCPKLVGYTEVVRVLHPRLREGASVVLFGGLAKERPYPGSTMVAAQNAGVSGLTRTLAVEIAPHRVNSLHPGVVGDSPRGRDTPGHPHIARTPVGRLVTMEEIADATELLLRNAGVNAHDLVVDGALLVT